MCCKPVPYSSTHRYENDFKVDIAGPLRLVAYRPCLSPTSQSGVACSGSFTVAVTSKGAAPPPPPPPPPCAPTAPHGPQSVRDCVAPPSCSGSSRSLQRTAAINELRVTCVEPNCEAHKAGTAPGAWVTVVKDMVLKQSDEISCDPDGVAVLAFADNSTTAFRNSAQFKIASYFTEGGVVRAEILLKMGEVAAQVNKSEATKSDFRIKSPTEVSSVRGTIFRVFVDPVGRASITSVQRGVVEVDPVKPGLPTVNVGAGKEVEVTATAISPIAPIGKAGARSGVNREKAVTLVMALLKRFNGPCKFTLPRYAGALGVKPFRAGWLVSVKVTGKVSGWSSWQVVGTKAAASNPLAKKIATGCH
jgi:hypothetical protein